MSLHEVDKSIRNTALWKLLVQKANAEMLPPEFMTGVDTICTYGLTLAKDIIRFFPTFTLHDNVHICNVCDWMYTLLGNHAKEITVADAALLVMSAACHDIGMSVSEELKEDLILDAQNHGVEWENYFLSHPEEDEEFRRTGKISDKMLRNYVRIHHHEHIGLRLPKGADWPRALVAKGISRDMFLRLCKSHGGPIDALNLTAADERSKECHLLPCAILLRLADILDFDASRAPKELYEHLGLDNPKDVETAFSKMEWDKNCTASHFELVDEIISFTAECTSMQVEYQVRAYMNWLQKELDDSHRRLAGRSDYWNGLRLPYKVEIDIQPDGYKSGPFCLTMEQSRIMELLAGRNLYNDPGVFVRELLQNAIDAIQTRVVQDNSFQWKDGKIVICTWTDDSGYSWFRIEDNGTGMDQEIILNHFLKIGSSYYNSDRFKTEMRKCDPKSHYMPISRFGIGILSCFMSDPENNRLQLSTKRFAQPGHPASAAIRMNVDGLQGYYYLAEEGQQATESDLLAMSHPSGESNKKNCYRSAAGTTICVRLNLYLLGGFRTLKEFVDRYVQFPKIRVEYYGQEGHFVYPTQQELMEEVHSLNPDGESQPPKEYCYYISDLDFAMLKIEHPEIVWETDQKPGIALRYCPLDWMTPGNQVSGVAVIAKIIKPKYHIAKNISHIKPSVEFRLSYYSSLRKLKLSIYYRLAENSLPSNVNYSYAELTADYPLINALPDFIGKSGKKSVESRTIVAFNGVLADQSQLLGESDGLVGMVILLQQNYRPEVNLARDAINELPLDGMAVLSVLQKKLGLNFRNENHIEAFRPNHFFLRTEKEFQTLLDELPALKNELKIGSHTLCETTELLQKQRNLPLPRINRDSFYDLLWLAAAKQLGTVLYKAHSGELELRNELNDDITASFPVALFFSMENKHASLGRIRRNNCNQVNSFNREHSFSKWLIKNQKELMKKVPGIYNTLLEDMMVITNEEELCKKLNEGLRRLQNIPNNPYNVTDHLFLRESDFF